MTSNTTVKTTAGMVRGSSQDGVLSFRGIPYGASTAGANRFRAPQPVAPWDGVLDALANRPSCPQPMMTTGGISLDPELMEMLGAGMVPESQDEDCLSLNVWTPATDGAPRPVMVWFHGGGWTVGSGNSPMYDGTRLARRGDVVIVTITHRLGAPGYLSLRDIPGATERDGADSGVAGALDMVAALEWVRDNIAAFGGDPSCVTIFGESGGGAKVCTLLAMPSAVGLFHRAIVQSGPMLRATPADDAATTTRAIMAKLGVADVDGLRAVPHEQLIEAQLDVLGGALGGFGTGHRLGPVLSDALPVHPFDPDAAQSAADVPLLIGTCRDEMTLFATAMPGLDQLTFEALPSVVAMVAGEGSQQLIGVYRSTRPQTTAADVLCAIWTDKAMGVASVRLAERKMAGGPAPTYLYRLDYTTPVLGGKLGVPHALDLGFMFDNLHVNTLYGGREGAQDLADRMADAWIAFARTGDPNHPGLPRWPAYDTSRRATMLFDERCLVADDPSGVERAAWDGHVLGL